MPSEPSGPALRIGGTSVPPGHSRTIMLTLPGRPRATQEDDALPVHVAVGRRPGPRLTVLGAPRGFEVVAVAAATAFAEALAPTSLAGSVLVVPLLRPGGRFAAGGRPLRAAAAWRFPGDAGGARREREAFTIFSETCAGATAIVLLAAPAPGQSGLSIARGDLGDPHFRRLATQAGLDAVVHAPAARGSLAAAARDTGATVIELVASSCESTPGTTAALLRALRRLGVVMGFATESFGLPAGATAPDPASSPRCPTFSRVLSLAAECGGLAEIHARPGQTFRHGEALARIAPLSAAPPLLVPSPRDALVLECPTARRSGVRRGANLFRLAVGKRAMRAWANGPGDTDATGATTTTASRAPAGELPTVAAPGEHERGNQPRPERGEAPLDAAAALGPPHELRVGWVERIALPLLGIARLKAKIDTGARTAALHVAKMRPVGTASGPHRRPILELTIPHGAPGGRRSVVVRAPIREYVQVKDTSGRSERRPVIVTTFRLGDIERRIRITLTDRADMLFPMLIGRTALGTGVIVDPARRYLVREPPRRARVARKRRAKVDMTPS